MRRAIACITGLVLLASFVTASGAAPPEVPDHLRGFSVLPPGQSGLPVSPHANDQVVAYSSLVDDDDVTEDELSTYFHDFQFGLDTIESELHPRSDVTIYKDSFGIPHIYGTTDQAAVFGAGYATAEDRLWQADLFRRAALGRLSEFLGKGFVGFDKGIRLSGYSKSELQSMYESLGPDLQSLLDAYSDGINARIDEIEAGTAAQPAEYFVQGLPIQQWKPTDTIALAVFQVRQFGEQSGAELRNAALLQGLRKRLGKKLGNRVFDDLLDRNDPNAYSTVPEAEGAFPSENLGKVDKDAVAMPDNAGKVWSKLFGRQAAADRALRGLNLQSPSSNFLAVAPSASVTGGSLEWGAPQVGYSTPEFFMELDLHSPSLDFRGPAIPGASVLPPVGRSIDYAWSLTVAVADAVDTRAELLCSPTDGKVTKASDHYRFKGQCRAMTRRTEKIQIGIGKDAETTSMKVFRTVHGPVMARGTVDGAPVAFVHERAFWKNEIDTLRGLYIMASNSTDTLEEFEHAVDLLTVGQNVVYADNENIAFWHGGVYPSRAKGVDRMLPVWGTGAWEWKGNLPFEDQPHMLNPAQGFIANWNNKPAVGWDNGDGTLWGATQRVGLLAQRMTDLLAGDSKATLSDVVDVARDAATVDANAVFLSDPLLSYVAGETGANGDARDAVAEWIAGGARRWDRDRNKVQDFAPAVAVWDTWYDELVHRTFDDELDGLYQYTPVPVSDDAAHSNGSAYFADFSNYLYNLFHDETSAELARDYCDDMTTGATETCADIARASLEAAVSDLTAAQGPSLDAWTWPADYIEFDEIGAVQTPDIPWQNRGTWNHAVEITGSR